MKNLFTIFSCPKPFSNRHLRLIQRNAIGSWLRLEPRPEILLLGDEEGTAEVAAEFGVRHIPKLTRNEHGTPLVSSVFEQAKTAASHRLLCYINADIILLSDFMEAVRSMTGWKRRFLLVGQRWDLEITAVMDFSQLQWEGDLRRMLSQKGVKHAVTGIDYFLFSGNCWGKIPPFALGRTAWDNWLIFRARQRGVAVIDATRAITAVHQNHNYAHIAENDMAAWTGTEAVQNQRLAGKKIFTLLDANWQMTNNGLTRVHTREYRRRSRESWTLLHPGWSIPLMPIKKILCATRRLRIAAKHRD